MQYCIALNCFSLHCSKKVFQYIALYFIALKCSVNEWTKIYYTIQHYILLYKSPSYSIALKYNSTIQHYTALHCTALYLFPMHYYVFYFRTLNFITLNFIGLHCISLFFTLLDALRTLKCTSLASIDSYFTVISFTLLYNLTSLHY